MSRRKETKLNSAKSNAFRNIFVLILLIGAFVVGSFMIYGGGLKYNNGVISGTLTSDVKVKDINGGTIFNEATQGILFDIFAQAGNEVGNIEFGMTYELDGTDINWDTLSVKGRIYRMEYSDLQGNDVAVQPIRGEEEIIGSKSGNIVFAPMSVDSIIPETALTKYDGVPYTWDPREYYHNFRLIVQGIYWFEVEDVFGNTHSDSFSQETTLDLIWAVGSVETSGETDFGESDASTEVLVKHLDDIRIELGQTHTFEWESTYSGTPKSYSIMVDGVFKYNSLSWGGENIMYDISFQKSQYIGIHEITFIVELENGVVARDTVRITVVGNEQEKFYDPEPDPVEPDIPLEEKSIDPLPIKPLDEFESVIDVVFVKRDTSDLLSVNDDGFIQILIFEGVICDEL